MADLLPPPFPISLILCDGIHTDPYTGRRTLLGEFDEYYSPHVPASIPILYVFAEVTECRGTVPVRIRFATSDFEHGLIWETEEAELVAESPLARLAVHWGIMNLTLPKLGVYMVQLVDGYDRVISQRRLLLTDNPTRL